MEVPIDDGNVLPGNIIACPFFAAAGWNPCGLRGVGADTFPLSLMVPQWCTR